MSRGFFSSVILVLIVIILFFFVTISSSTKPIIFSDLPRYIVLSAEEAYSLLDKELFSDFIIYEKFYGCGVIQSDAQGFEDFLKKQNFNSKNCTSNLTDIEMNFDKNALKGKITANINCALQNEIEKYEYSKTFIFNKQYESVSVGGNCVYAFKDLDADYLYYHG